MKLPGKTRTMIPKGVATFLPEGTSRRRQIEREILSIFSQWGYQEVITPIFEYLDVFSLGVGEELLNRAYKFVDRATGRMMVLRPDVTPQIARIAATLLNDQPLPIRLCYSANVFRHEEEHAGREREIHQIGGELIGPSDAEADAETISLAIEILQKLGLKSFKIALGQMAFTRGVLQPFESSPVLFKKILGAVAKKDVSHLEALLKEEKVGQKTRRQVLSLLDLFGGEEVFDAAKPLADHPVCKAGLRRLREVYEILTLAGHQESLLIDLGEVRGFDYYTGTIFEIFSEGVGSELGGGGRYDHLLEKFGAPASSTGFALHLERIQWALEQRPGLDDRYASADFLVLHTAGAASEARSLSHQLREGGYRVIRRNGFHGGIDAYLADARKQKIAKILLLTGRVGKAVRSIDVRTGRQADQNLSEFLEGLKSS
ncbi:MAG: ATP phosphoribosyltransferase regulatory subunit [Candidatus Manganitrophaceae bacterium]|nr:MAG: ATP phosphoribosyltransferase regulatory subunit [Candidatus Manganitrophaceae bacterium]